MAPTPRLRALAIFVLVSVPSVVSAFLGVAAGRYLMASSFRQQTDPWISVESLGGASVGQREEIALAFKDSDRAFAEMDEYAWVVPNVPTPFVGAGPKPGRSGNTEINSLQFRSDREIEASRPEGRFRIFLTGGSVAFGAGAPGLDSTIGGYLETFLNQRPSVKGVQYEVFTFANPAWASTQERIAIENRLSELDPDLIVSVSGGNDVIWAGYGRNVFWFRTFQDETFWNLIRIAYEATGQDLADVVHLGPVPAEVVADRMAKNIRLSTFATSMAGGRYVFVLQPTLVMAKKPRSAREKRMLQRHNQKLHVYTKAVYTALRARLRELDLDGFQFIDAVDAFSSLTANDELFLDLYHLGDRGNEIIARGIARRLCWIPGSAPKPEC
jgi:hypothetical protein